MGPYGIAMQLVYDRTDAGAEVVGPPQRWMIKSNWKLGAEQFNGDAYHATFAHGSMVAVGRSPNFEQYSSQLEWTVYAQPASDYEEVIARDGRLLPPGLTPALFDQACKRSPLFAGFHEVVPLGPGASPAFPNFSSLFLNTPGLDGKLATVMSPRLFQPHSVDEMEVLVWVTVERDAPDEMKEAARICSTQNFSPSGAFEQDDAEMWAGIQRTATGPMSRRRVLDYRADGAHQVAQPGTLMKGFNDNAQWSFWMRWLDFMSDKPWQAPFTAANPTATFGMDSMS